MHRGTWQAGGFLLCLARERGNRVSARVTVALRAMVHGSFARRALWLVWPVPKLPKFCEQPRTTFKEGPIRLVLSREGASCGRTREVVPHFAAFPLFSFVQKQQQIRFCHYSMDKIFVLRRCSRRWWWWWWLTPPALPTPQPAGCRPVAACPACESGRLVRFARHAAAAQLPGCGHVMSSSSLI